MRTHEMLVAWLTSESAVRVGWVLVHSLWEGAAVCALVGALLWMLRKAGAAARYAVTAAGMVLMLFLPVGTFFVVSGEKAGVVLKGERVGMVEQQVTRAAAVVPAAGRGNVVRAAAS